MSDETNAESTTKTTDAKAVGTYYGATEQEFNTFVATLPSGPTKEDVVVALNGNVPEEGLVIFQKTNVATRQAPKPVTTGIKFESLRGSGPRKGSKAAPVATDGEAVPAKKRGRKSNAEKAAAAAAANSVAE